MTRVPVGEGEFELDVGEAAEAALSPAATTRPIEPDRPAALTTATKSRERNCLGSTSRGDGEQALLVDGDLKKVVPKNLR